MRILFAWLGQADVRAAQSPPSDSLGPIADAIRFREFARVVLLTNWEDERPEFYVRWLSTRTSAELKVENVCLTSPTNFGEIYQAAKRVVLRETDVISSGDQRVYHLSPGTPAMAAVWILLAKTLLPAELIESSIQEGVRTVEIPFDISAEFRPDLLHRADTALERLSEGHPPATAEFRHIIHRSPQMARVVERASRVAPRSVPVLIEGESGTGKELLARAIHKASRRAAGPLVVINCGAIPQELVESELFGHVRGAFTGATRDRTGVFEAASGGTIFLDEIGELPLQAQVKLLRVLQEHEVTRVGSDRPHRVDARLIAATNRSLAEEVVAARFREDLFYRIAVAVLRLPPLRDRQGDIGLLIDSLVAKINRDAAAAGFESNKKISAAARNILLKHTWPGNIRELQNTLQRAIVWSAGGVIEAADIEDALLLPPRSNRAPDILGQPLDSGINLQAIMSYVASHYLRRALAEAGGNKSRAAQMVGLPSYQTFSNWMRRYGVE